MEYAPTVEKLSRVVLHPTNLNKQKGSRCESLFCL